MKKKVFLIFLIFLSTPFTAAIEDIDILFSAADTKYINITIDNAQINSLSFNITGGLYDSSYPSNITIDVGNDSLIDWEYNSYHSNISAYAEIVTTAWSTNPNSAEVDIMSNMTDLGNGVNLGYLQNNIFYDYANVQNGTLGIREFEGNSISEQIMSIVTNTSTIHAFLPSISGYFAFAGVYVAKGGSTYYCNSDHTFYDVYGCNLTVAEAMTPTHLARESNASNYSTTKPVTNSKMKDTINSQLAICGSPPCNITIEITSATPGNITLSDFQVIGTDAPANITITENTTDYNVNISPYTTLTDVKYFYGDMPNVYIAPVVAKDNITALSANQSARLNMLESTLRQGWDNLTNFSHPLNFNFYMTPIVINYSVSENDFSNFSNKAYEEFESNIESPAIIVILDIYDYFPNRSSYITRTTIDEHGRIGLVYLNGFSDHNNDTVLYNYDSEILRNVLLHELMHAFVFYPSVDNMFYSDHPSSFTDIDNFETYNASESPTTNEGYYEVYSILNQLRPYIASEDIYGYVPSLSTLDKMLLGIVSKYSEGNYTFYSGNVTDVGNRYNATAMTANETTNASYLYSFANMDLTYWDITNSSGTDMGVSQSFSVSKSGQDNRSLWIFAEDAGHPDYFKMFNLNSNSIQTTLDTTAPTSVSLNLPADNSNSSTQTITFNCSAINFDGLSNITLYGNWSGWHANETNDINGASNSTVFTKNLSSGSYEWNCLGYGTNGDYDWGDTNYTLTTDSTGPTITIASPTNTSYTSDSVELNVSADEPVSSWWYSNNSGTVNNTFSPNQTYIWEQGVNTIYVWANDSFNNIGVSNVTFFIDSISPNVNLNSPADGNSGTSQDVIFNCSTSDDVSLGNITLYGNWSGWHANESVNISGTSNSTTFAKNLPSGSYEWNCLGYDTNGNYDWGDTNYTLMIDSTNPTITIISPTNTSYTSAATEFNYTYVEENCDSVWYSNDSGANNYSVQSCGVNFTGLISSEGSNNWVLYMNDSFGNENSSSVTFFVNSLAPEVNINLPLNQNHTSLSVNITLSEQGYCEYSIGGGNITMTNSGNIDFTHINSTISDGQYTLTAYCNDSYGNINYTESVMFGIDSTDPVMTIVSPANTSYATDSIGLNVSADESISSWWYSNNSGATNNTFSPNQTYTWEQGVNTIYVWANDSLNNIGTSSVTFFIDSIFPNVSLNSPTNGNSGTNQDITFNCSANDGVNLENVTLYGSWSGWHANESVNISGTSNSTTFAKNLPVGSYLWNCLFVDIEGDYGWGSSNYSLIITAPISCGDSICNGAETCSTCSADCGTCSSGGGGSGSNDDDSAPVDNNNTANDDDDDKETGNKNNPIDVVLHETENAYTGLEEDSNFVFNIGGKEYTLILENVGRDTVSFRLMPGSIIFDLEKEKENKINISQDEALYVRLDNISSGNVDLVLMKIAGRNMENYSAGDISLMGSKDSGSPDLTWVIVVCCLVIGFVSVFFYRKYNISERIANPYHNKAF